MMTSTSKVSARRNPRPVLLLNKPCIHMKKSFIAFPLQVELRIRLEYFGGALPVESIEQTFLTGK